MDAEEAHKLLQALDSEYDWRQEALADFPYEEEVWNVRRIQKHLESSLGIPLRVDICSAQDSYFFAEIGYTSQSENTRCLLLNIRFSNFGRMVSAWARDGIPTRAKNIQAVIGAVVEKEGYRYISSDWLLRTPYDGRRYPNHAGSVTWWRRFFDYL